MQVVSFRFVSCKHSGPGSVLGAFLHISFDRYIFMQRSKSSNSS